MPFQLGFLGAGNMAEAIARAAIDHEIIPLNQIIASDPSETRRNVFASLGVETTDDNTRLAREAGNILLAVKPQAFPEAAGDLKEMDIDRQIVLSIMAGIPSTKIEQLVGKPMRIVRIMPNTPVFVGCGMAGVALSEHAREGDDDLAMRLFNAAGKAIRFKEDQLHAVTAVSGSGPAYVFYLAEAMQDAAGKLGLGEHARLLVTQTLLGAARMLGESPDDAAELRRKVTSPGGTTERAIACFDQDHMRRIIAEGMKACEAKSRELGK